MKIRTTIFILIIIQGWVLAGSPETAFHKGNQLYINKKYAGALTEYLNIYREGYTSPELLYNIGNCYYRLEDYSRAQLFYYRSLKIKPGNKKAKHNLEKAKLYNVDKLDEIPEFFLTSWFRSIYGLMKSNTWIYLSIALFILALISFTVYFMFRNVAIRKAGFWLGIAWIILSTLFLVFALKSNYSAVHIKEGVLLSPTVIVKNSPDFDEKDKYIIHEGIKATVTDSIGDWYEIRLSDGKDGWILKKDLALI